MIKTEEMKYSDQLLQRAFGEGRGLTTSERHELREAYLWEQAEDEKVRSKLSDSVKNFRDEQDPLNMPRHRVLSKFPHMTECPFCFKIRGYNTAVLSERNYMEDHPDDFCMKPHIHNERNFAMMITRERIDLDGKE